MQKLTIVAALALAACTATKDDSGDTAAETTDTGSEDTSDSGTPAVTGSAEWTATGVAITLNNATAPLSFGMAETTEGGWLGEDCLPGNACHPLAVGSTINLVSVNTIAEVQAGSTTLLKSTMQEGITYYVADATGSCWVWGHNVAHYASKSCTEL